MVLGAARAGCIWAVIEDALGPVTGACLALCSRTQGHTGETAVISIADDTMLMTQVPSEFLPCELALCSPQPRTQ